MEPSKKVPARTGLSALPLITVRGDSIVLEELSPEVEVRSVTIVRTAGEPVAHDVAVAALRRGRSFAHRDMRSVIINFTSPRRARERLDLAAPPTRVRVLSDGLSYNLLFATVRLRNVVEPNQLLDRPRPRRILGIAGDIDAGGLIRTAVALDFAEEVWLLRHSLKEVATPKASHSTAGALLRVGALVVNASMHDFAERCRQLGAGVYIVQAGSASAPSRPAPDEVVAVVVGAKDTARQLAHLKPHLVGLHVNEGVSTPMAAVSIALHDVNAA